MKMHLTITKVSVSSVRPLNGKAEELDINLSLPATDFDPLKKQIALNATNIRLHFKNLPSMVPQAPYTKVTEHFMETVDQIPV